jgi:hypothetical protein
MNFLVNTYFILQISHAQALKMRYNWLLGDDHVTVFSLLGDVIPQQAEKRQILVLRPF